jgi:hypothetical protein
MGTFAKLAVCFGVYFVGFIGSNIYRDFHHMHPSPALGTQLGFVLALVCWFLLPRKQ